MPSGRDCQPDRWSHFESKRRKKKTKLRNEIVVDFVPRSEPIANDDQQHGQPFGRGFLPAETRPLKVALRPARHAAHSGRNVPRRRPTRRPARQRPRSLAQKTHFHGRVSFKTPPPIFRIEKINRNHFTVGPLKSRNFLCSFLEMEKVVMKRPDSLWCRCGRESRILLKGERLDQYVDVCSLEGEW